MVQSIIALIAVAVLIRMSLAANARFCSEARLPMQWSLDGSVNWTAPRVVALAITPILALCILAAIIATTFYLTPRPGQEGMEIPAVLFTALMFVAVHWLHIWMIDKSLKNNGR